MQPRTAGLTLDTMQQSRSDLALMFIISLARRARVYFESLDSLFPVYYC